MRQKSFDYLVAVGRGALLPFSLLCLVAMTWAVIRVNNRPKTPNTPLHSEALYYQRPENVDQLKKIIKAHDGMSDLFDDLAYLGFYIFSGYTFFALILFIDERRRRKAEQLIDPSE